MQKNIRHLCLLLLVIFCQRGVVLGQRVWIENIRTTSDVGKVIVTYDLLSDATEGLVEITGISLTFGREGGRLLTPRSVSGVSLSLGRDSRIAWDCAADGYELEEYLTPRLNVSYKLKREREPYEPEMVFVQGGTFQMGSNDYGDEKPMHSVTVSSFSIGKYEITFSEYDKFCEATNREKPSDSGWGRGSRPVIHVSWHDAVAYCEWLSKMTGKHYRLPTEAEWEYAARGGNQSKGYKWAGTSVESSLYQYGNFCDKNCSYSWKDGNQNDGYEYTAPVGRFNANELGLYDMTGNVWEWCSDWYDAKYYSSSAVVNPTGAATGSSRVLRGGGWDGRAAGSRCAYRGGSGPASRGSGYGFRVLLILQ